MPLINFEVELKFRWAKYCILSVAGIDNVNGNDIGNATDNGNGNDVPAVTLSARDNQKLSKLLSKGFERSVYWIEFKTKCDNKNTTNEFRYFLESNFVGANRLLVLAYSNQDAACNRFRDKKYYLYIIKRYEEIIKLTTGQGEDYTTGCLLEYNHIKNHYRLIAVDLSRQKQLDSDPKAFN